jgi:hypothetical protein
MRKYYPGISVVVDLEEETEEATDDGPAVADEPTKEEDDSETHVFIEQNGPEDQAALVNDALCPEAPLPQ